MKLLLSVPEASAALSLGQTTFWALLRNGEAGIDSVLIGRRRLIVAASLERYIERLVAGQAQERGDA